MQYSKYSGAGNTFLFFDNRKETFSLSQVTLLCEKEGVDGVILLEHPLKMRIFNRDGSEASMCGNGLRCFIRYLAELGILQAEYHIETGAGLLKACLVGEEVAVTMSTPHSMNWSLPVEISETTFVVDSLNTGVPHAILFVDEIEKIDLMSIGRLLRTHPRFAPEGTNVTFASFDGEQLHVRTYERGVEGETLACGTGAVAAALASSRKFSLPSPIAVLPRSKERLTISFAREGETFTQVIMQGPAKKLSQGSCSI